MVISHIYDLRNKLSEYAFKGAMMRRLIVAGAMAACLAMGNTSDAAIYSYVDWQTANPGGGTASGVITIGASTVNVNFAATFAGGAPGSFFFAQTSGGGTNYWNPSSPYISAQVENAPPTTDIVSLIGGANQIYTVTLSEAIKDPIMSIVSLGRSGLPTSYDFDSPFTIVSQGAGFFGGSATALQQLPGDILVGNEGHGTIQFIGTFSTFSWVVPTPENWHGFTFGIRTTEAIEPNEIPEPASLVLLLFGTAGIAGLKRFRQQVG